jgi:hypothetical protein
MTDSEDEILSVPSSVFQRDRYDANEFTKCYLFRSTDGRNWKREAGPFPHSEGLIVAEAEERRVKEYEDATRQPNGSYRTYSFLIRCYTPEEEVPNNLSTLRD